MNGGVLYDRIGERYGTTRRAEPSLVDAIAVGLALPPDSAIADIGAGTGNYARALADRGMHVRAIEPSATMRTQAEPHPRIEWIDAKAESIPLEAGSVDGVICVLALHHFDLDAAATEMARVAGAGPIVLVTFESTALNDFWLSDYCPHLLRAHARFRSIPEAVKVFETVTGRAVRVEPFALPRDCRDIFAAGAWAHPERYLEPQVRAGISAFALTDAREYLPGIERLRDDLASGAWHDRYGERTSGESYDAGYRILIVEAATARS